MALNGHRTFKDPAFKSGPFQPPLPPSEEGVEPKAELDNLRAELARYRATHQDKSQALDQVSGFGELCEPVEQMEPAA